MRIAMFARNKGHTQTTRSIARALARAGHDVLAISEGSLRRALGRRLSRAWILRRVEGFRPDFVLVHKYDVSQEIWRELSGGFPMVVFSPDARSEVTPELLGRWRQADLVCTVAKGQVPEIEQAGVKRAAWVAEAHDPALYFPVEQASGRWHSDVAYIGKYNRDDRHLPRADLVRQVAEHFDLALYGEGWETAGLTTARAHVFPRQYRQICRGAKIVLGRDWRVDCALYFSNRTWFTLGCGGFLLTSYVPRLEEVFENHGHLVWYRSDEECLELLRHYLPRPEERRRIAERGHAFARAHRTYDDFARDLVDAFRGRPPAFPPARQRLPGNARPDPRR